LLFEDVAAVQSLLPGIGSGQFHVDEAVDQDLEDHLHRDLPVLFRQQGAGAIERRTADFLSVDPSHDRILLFFLGDRRERQACHYGKHEGGGCPSKRHCGFPFADRRFPRRRNGRPADKAHPFFDGKAGFPSSRRSPWVSDFVSKRYAGRDGKVTRRSNRTAKGRRTICAFGDHH